MSPNKLQSLRCFLTERLTAAAVEIFGEVESVVEEYREENKRLQQMLNNVLRPDSKLHIAAARRTRNTARASTMGLRLNSLPPQLLVCEEEVHPEQQERSPILLQGLEEADIVRLTSTPVHVKSEHDEESSWFNQTQTDDNREAEPLASTSTEEIKTEPDGEVCGVSQPASNVGYLEPTRDVQLLSSGCSGTETDDMEDDWKPQSGLKKLISKKTQKRQSDHELKSSGHTPAKKIRKTTSAIWEHFTISTTDTTNVICKLCMATLSRGRDVKHLTTSVMHNHMHFKHPVMTMPVHVPPAWANTQPQPASSLSPIMAVFNSKTLYPDNRLTAEQITQTVDERICRDLLPAGDLEPTIDVQLLSSHCYGTETLNRAMESSHELKSSGHTPARKSRRTTSAIWEHFTISTTDTTNVICKLCTATISRGRDVKHLSTRPLHNHVLYKHPLVLANTQRLPASSLSPIISTFNPKTLYPDNQPTVKQITENVGESYLS